MSSVVMSIPFFFADPEMFTLGEAMITVNAEGATLALEAWLLSLVLGSPISIATIDPIFSRLTVGLNILLLLTILEDFLPAEEVSMVSLVLGFWLMSLLPSTSAKFLIKSIKCLADKRTQLLSP